jgi:hypothetical protein
MHRVTLFSLLLLAGALTGCDRFRDLFSAHADVAAEAGSQQLSSERLAEVLSGGKGIKPNHQTANFVSNIWIDYALFAQAAAEGKLPMDSAGIAQAVWPEMAELKGSHWHDTLLARRSNFSPGTVCTTLTRFAFSSTYSSGWSLTPSRMSKRPRAKRPRALSRG